MSFGNGNGNGEIVISTPLRTGIGTVGGALKEVPATDLGATVGREVLSRSGIEGEQVDQVIIGNILSAGQGMNPGRQVGIKSGVPVEVPGMTLNRMCGSGLQAIDRKSTRLNSSHANISYAVFCLNKQTSESGSGWHGTRNTPRTSRSASATSRSLLLTPINVRNVYFRTCVVRAGCW